MHATYDTKPKRDIKINGTGNLNVQNIYSLSLNTISAYAYVVSQIRHISFKSTVFLK